MNEIASDSYLQSGRIYIPDSDGAFRTTIDPAILVRTAIQRKEFSRLLLGEEPYRCLPKYMVSPAYTDVDSLLGALCFFVHEYSLVTKRTVLLRSIHEIINAYEGIFPVTYCLVFELGIKKNKHKDGFGLPVEEIVQVLRKTIVKYGERLVFDNTDEGFGRPLGRFDFLCYLDRLCREYGGIAFVD